jgi:hypothetical protein
MSSIAVERFKCSACGKALVWKPQLAGKRAKCKCGAVVTVPAATGATPQAAIGPKVIPPTTLPQTPKASAPKVIAPKEPDLDDLYALAPSGGIADDEVAPPPLAPLPAMAAVAPAGAPRAARGGKPAPVAYLGRATPAQKDRFATSNLMDPTRDIYAPTGIFLAGFLMYLGYYVFTYDMGGVGIALTSLGLGILTVSKAAILIVAAMLLAGPLGVSFGDVWTAPLKLAAIAVFSDGVTTWVDAALQAGGAGGLAGVVSFPVALCIYWVLMIYLFNMDAGDSWLVVMLLSVFDSLVRWLLLMLLLNSVLGWGGVAGGALPGAGMGAGVTQASAAQVHVQNLKGGGHLHEARQRAADGKSTFMMEQVTAWYAAGAKTVWFETGSRDINGKSNLEGIIVELPDDPTKRAVCYKILDDFYRARGDEIVDPTIDDGEPFLTVPMSNSRW